MANSLTHTKWMCKYHIVFIPKYRRKMLYYKLRKDLSEIIGKLCQYKGIKNNRRELNARSCTFIVTNTTKDECVKFHGIFKRHANLKYKLGNRNFWTTGYYVSTVGLNEATIKKYIREQEKEDQIEDKMTKKEYKNPFKG